MIRELRCCEHEYEVEEQFQWSDFVLFFGDFVNGGDSHVSRQAYLPNRANRYASSGPPFPSYASWPMSSANGSVYRAICRGPASTGSKPASRISSAATPLPLALRFKSLTSLTHWPPNFQSCRLGGVRC